MTTWQHRLAEELLAAGADSFTVIPDGRIAATSQALTELGAQVRQLTREEECVGYAAGARAAGGHPVVMMQCSGLGNAANALGSLAIPYGLGLLLIISMRGTFGERNPSQVPIGRATYGILDALGIEYARVTSAEAIPAAVSGGAALAFGAGHTAALTLEPELGGRREYA